MLQTLELTPKAASNTIWQKKKPRQAKKQTKPKTKPTQEREKKRIKNSPKSSNVIVVKSNLSSRKGILAFRKK